MTGHECAQPGRSLQSIVIRRFDAEPLEVSEEVYDREAEGRRNTPREVHVDPHGRAGKGVPHEAVFVIIDDEAVSVDAVRTVPAPVRSVPAPRGAEWENPGLATSVRHDAIRSSE